METSELMYACVCLCLYMSEIWCGVVCVCVCVCVYTLFQIFTSSSRAKSVLRKKDNVFEKRPVNIKRDLFPHT